ncbi:Ubiquitin carboxyl-terminal hydrolase 12, partial [Bienertia sinuspersici]
AYSKLQGALSKSKTKRIDSTEFKAGGYTWVLSVYPKGNEKEDGDARDKRFTALKNEWGIPKLLPLKSFTNACNGFLVNDCCVFGAEILVRNGQVKRSILSHLESKSERSYTWKIEEFSNLSNNRLDSPVFSFGEWSWYVL